MSTELNTRFITQLGYLATALTDLFFWCLYGTRVQYKVSILEIELTWWIRFSLHFWFQSFDLVETVFNTPWYVMNPRFRPYLSFIILRAQNPPLITGGGLLYMNFNVFLKVQRNLSEAKTRLSLKSIINILLFSFLGFKNYIQYACSISASRFKK